jgi:hypothetical protein
MTHPAIDNNAGRADKPQTTFRNRTAAVDVEVVSGGSRSIALFPVPTDPRRDDRAAAV